MRELLRQVTKVCTLAKSRQSFGLPPFRSVLQIGFWPYRLSRTWNKWLKAFWCEGSASPICEQARTNAAKREYYAPFDSCSLVGTLSAPLIFEASEKCTAILAGGCCLVCGIDFDRRGYRNKHWLYRWRDRHHLRSLARWHLEAVQDRLWQGPAGLRSLWNILAPIDVVWWKGSVLRQGILSTAVFSVALTRTCHSEGLRNRKLSRNWVQEIKTRILERRPFGQWDYLRYYEKIARCNYYRSCGRRQGLSGWGGEAFLGIEIGLGCGPLWMMKWKWQRMQGNARGGLSAGSSALMQVAAIFLVVQGSGLFAQRSPKLRLQDFLFFCLVLQPKPDPTIFQQPITGWHLREK